MTNCIELSRFRAALFALREIFPFFGTVAAELRVIPPTREQLYYMRANQGIASISKLGVMTYDPKKTALLKEEHLMTILAHEAMHIALKIFERAIGLDPKIANFAHDYVINDMLLLAGLSPIEGWLHDKRFRNKSFEEVYVILVEDNSKTEPVYQPKLSCPLGSCGTNEELASTLDQSASTQTSNSEAEEPNSDSHEDSNQAKAGIESPSEFEDRIKNALKRADEEDKKSPNSIRGKTPSNIWKVFDEVINPTLSFQPYIQQFIGRYGKRDKASFSKRNRRNSYKHNEPFLPGKMANKPKVYILIDTSGSMTYDDGPTLLAKSLGTTIKIANQYQIPVEIFMADAGEPSQLTAQEVREAISDRKFNLIGGGGSDFRPAFKTIQKMIQQENPMGCPVLVFTDGDISVPQSPCLRLANCTIWITPEDKQPPASWGLPLNPG